ncbi:MAG: hypothetical protein M1609_10335 [Firmicutes bacterium]|nr:hypothetical protein [Bacillota bacterium]
MSEEKRKILEMIQAGKITAAEGMDLLDALEDGEPKEVSAGSPRLSNRFLRVRVDNAKSKVNVNVPLGLLKATSKLVNMGMGFIPEEARQEMQKKGVDFSKINFEELVGLIDQGLVDGKLVDVDTDDPQEGRTKVEVYVE